MGVCRLDIQVARQDLTATLAAPPLYYTTLVVLFSTTVAFLCSQEPCSWDNRHWYKVLSDYTISRQPDCVFHKTKQVLVHTKSSIPILLLIFLLRGRT